MLILRLSPLLLLVVLILSFDDEFVEFRLFRPDDDEDGGDRERLCELFVRLSLLELDDLLAMTFRILVEDNDDDDDGGGNREDTLLLLFWMLSYSQYIIKIIIIIINIIIKLIIIIINIIVLLCRLSLLLFGLLFLSLL